MFYEYGAQAFEIKIREISDKTASRIQTPNLRPAWSFSS
uniref:Uncharacterized protein n=1 Tax=Anguilla anguilla TaxID=7936 RepID=A0A0E9QJF3_ANGAN